jgi:hypothetical protein
MVAVACAIGLGSGASAAMYDIKRRMVERRICGEVVQ